MIRQFNLALLALIALSVSTQAQDPVYALLPHESELTDAVVGAEVVLEVPAELAEETTLDAATLTSHVDAHIGPGPYAGDISYHGVGTGCSACGGVGCSLCNGGGAIGGGCASCGGAGCLSCGGGCSGCVQQGGGCMGGCCMSCCNEWRVRSRSMIIARETNDDTTIVFENVAFAGGALVAGNALIEGGNFNMGSAAGFDISLAQGDGYGGEIEARLFHLNELRDVVRGTGDDVEINNLILANGAQPIVALTNTRTNPVNVFAQYDSEFDTMELNYREPFCPWWVVTVGFRYVSLEEALEIRTRDASVPTLRSQTRYFVDNDMYGLQIGSDVILASNPMGLELRGTARLGIYYNDVKSQVISSGNLLVNGGGANRQGETGWLGEFGLEALYHYNCNTSFVFGYHLISIDGVALATEQVTSVVNPLQGPILDVGVNRGTAFYHGASLGIELRW